MTADLAHLVTVKHVADVRLETCVSCSHCSHDSRDTAAHHCVELGLGLVAKKRRNGDCVHRQLLLEVPKDLQSLRVKDFGAVVSCGGKDGEVLAESYGVDLDSFVNGSLDDDFALHVVVYDAAVSSGNEEGLIVDIP